MTPRAIRLILAGVILVGCQASAAEPAEHRETPSPHVARPRTTPHLDVPAMPTDRATVAATPIPSPTPTATQTLPPPAAFALDLYREGDFVPQHTFEWCVGASIQMAFNMVRDETRSSYGDQQALWEMARDRSSNSFNGANPRGWAAVLDEIGVGPYELVAVPDYAEALRTAAAAIQETQRPVGLVMWRGRHAWVMSGFESIGDPAIHPDFTVTGVRVLDPLYPHGSGTWGPSPAPNSLLSPDELAKQFVIREPRRWSSDLGAGYLLVLPVPAVRASG